MRTPRSVLPALLAAALLGVPALSLAASLPSVGSDQSGCPEPGVDGADVENSPQQKSTAAKRGTGRDAGKSRQTTPYRSGDAPARGAPRWHRFLPGMYR